MYGLLSLGIDFKRKDLEIHFEIQNKFRYKEVIYLLIKEY